MDTNPQHDAGSRLPHGVPNGHAGSEIQSADLPEAGANSRLSTIREMARDFQVRIRALRFYEDRGLLHPRRESTDRQYDARDRLHLKMILKGKQLGFTLSEIHDIPARRGEDSGKTDLDMGLLPEQISVQISYLVRQRSQIDAAINTLREAHRRLHELPRQGAGLSERSGHLSRCRNSWWSFATRTCSNFLILGNSLSIKGFHLVAKRASRSRIYAGYMTRAKAGVPSPLVPWFRCPSTGAHRESASGLAGASGDPSGAGSKRTIQTIKRFWRSTPPFTQRNRMKNSYQAPLTMTDAPIRGSPGRHDSCVLQVQQNPWREVMRAEQSRQAIAEGRPPRSPRVRGAGRARPPSGGQGPQSLFLVPA